MLDRLAKETPARNHQCSLLLAPEDYQLFAVESLNVPAEELKSAMRWRLKDMLDYHVDDATIDVLNVPGDKNADGRSHSMYAVAARNKLIAERQTAFVSAKLPLTVIDIPDMAQSRHARYPMCGDRPRSDYWHPARHTGCLANTGVQGQARHTPRAVVAHKLRERGSRKPHLEGCYDHSNQMS